MPQNKPPQRPVRTESPSERLRRLNQRLSYVGAVKNIVTSEDWKTVEDHLRAAINLQRKNRDSVDPDDPASLQAHGQRALFVTGKIQGMEYVLNDFLAAMQEEQNLRDDIKETEADLKGKK